MASLALKSSQRIATTTTPILARLLSSSSTTHDASRDASHIPGSSPRAPLRSPDSKNPHEAQSTQRANTLTKAAEQGGVTANLVQKAVQHTVNLRQQRTERSVESTRTTNQSRADSYRPSWPRRNTNNNNNNRGEKTEGNTTDISASTPRTPRNQGPRRPSSDSGASSPLGNTLLQRRKESGAVYDPDAQAISASNPPRFIKPFNGPRQGNRTAPSISSDWSEQRPSRRSSPSSTSASPSTNSSSRPPRPTTPRAPRPPTSSSRPKKSSPNSSRTAPSAPIVPLVTPARVHYPSLDLAALISADLASRTLSLKKNDDHEDQAVRLQARAERKGDYSRWVPASEGEEGGDKKKKATKQEKVVQHASGLLSANPSVGLEGRELVLSKLQEALRR